MYLVFEIHMESRVFFPEASVVAKECLKTHIKTICMCPIDFNFRKYITYLNIEKGWNQNIPAKNDIGTIQLELCWSRNPGMKWKKFIFSVCIIWACLLLY